MTARGAFRVRANAALWLTLCLLLAIEGGCARLDPRAPCFVHLEARDGAASATVSYKGPTPFFVEPSAEAEAREGRAAARIGARASEARAFWSSLAGSVLSFLAGWLVGPAVFP